MCKRLLMVACLGAATTLVAVASPITYHVDVPFPGECAGSGASCDLFFQFSPTPASLTPQAATVKILNFETNGTIVSDAPAGSFTGSLLLSLGSITLLSDSSGGSSYDLFLSPAAFGRFDLEFDGDFLANPDGASISTFFISLYNGSSPLLSSDPTGAFWSFDVNSFDPAIVSNNLDASGTVTAGEVTAGVPEPPGVVLLGGGLVCLAGWRKRAGR